MTIRTQKQLALLSIIGLAYWLFGNLYEAIVISPNWVVDSPAQLRRLNEFFVRTSPTIYFVPITQLATIGVWVLFWKNRETSVKAALIRASLWALAATLLNGFIVSTIVLKLFASDFDRYGDYLTTLAWRWNVLNLVRMILVGTTVHYLFSAFRKLDRME
ncbi:hypothetical protein [Fibrella aquatilis]|uniref:DUF1772 domain-containing protein n=1 Tax=Fibrella aquatilis TaxID=2817059 RepID=A0A939K169_9BACT|nr:hypothetical protein [Fibrella aquatilis]MBO0931960.1 hypothetical protein [Fibrella aquatilis]